MNKHLQKWAGALAMQSIADHPASKTLTEMIRMKVKNPNNFSTYHFPYKQPSPPSKLTEEYFPKLPPPLLDVQKAQRFKLNLNLTCC